MLRVVFVFLLLAAGVVLALKGPFYGLLLYVWNAYFRPEDWVWSPYNEIIVSLSISYYVGAYVVIASILSGQRFRFSLHVLLFGLFVFQTFLSARGSEQPEYSWDEWQEYAKSFLITYFIAVLVTDLRRLRYLVLAMSLSLGFEGAKQGWAQMILRPGGMNTNPVPFLGDNNGVAVGMLMLVPLFAALAGTTARKWPRRAYRFLLVGVLYRALSTYSRGGFLAAGALAVAYWLRSKGKAKVLIGILAAAAIVLPVMPDAFWERMGTIRSFKETDEGSALGRLHFWKVAAIMARENPVLGVGFQAYNRSYDAYDPAHGEYGANRSAHSVWFGVLAELGYPGLLLYLAVLILAFRSCHRARKLAGEDPSLKDLQKYATSVETCLVVFVVGGTFLPFQYNEMYFHVVGLSMALAGIAESRRRARPAAGAASRGAPRERPAPSGATP
ncbi:MAG: putative O-glycosylation ligase, exosortase A system-associated [Planctomycetes bacterium]|nr:putative O-glycosylation ligase, exosortase A system-associated [Planctomycetota bacterium]